MIYLFIIKIKIYIIFGTKNNISSMTFCDLWMVVYVVSWLTDHHDAPPTSHGAEFHPWMTPSRVSTCAGVSLPLLMTSLCHWMRRVPWRDLVYSREFSRGTPSLSRKKTTIIGGCQTKDIQVVMVHTACLKLLESTTCQLVILLDTQ